MVAGAGRGGASDAAGPHRNRATTGTIPRVLARLDPRVVAPRLPGLLLGLALFGFGIALMAEARLGLGPWEAFHQGISRLTGLELGTVSIALGVPILALWWPLGERPGAGTLLNVVLIGSSTNVSLGLLPAFGGAAVQLAAMLLGVVVIGVGSGLYL